MRATLFGVPGSHPASAGELMLEQKGVEVRRLDLVAGVHRVILRALGFPRMTVPAVDSTVSASRARGRSRWPSTRWCPATRSCPPSRATARR